MCFFCCVCGRGRACLPTPPPSCPLSQHRILNPLSQGQTRILMDTSQIHFCCATMGTPLSGLLRKCAYSWQKQSKHCWVAQLRAAKAAWVVSSLFPALQRAERHCDFSLCLSQDEGLSIRMDSKNVKRTLTGPHT